MWKKIISLALLICIIISAAGMSGISALASSVSFAWPVPGYTSLARGFGNGHYGLDIIVSEGTPVYASAAGTVQVVYTGCNNFDGAASDGQTCLEKGICNPSKGYYKDGFCNSAYGNAVMIKHADGTWTAYAHLSDIASGIAVGSTVSAGQLLGYSGSTGRSSGEHLHFEMRTGDGEGEEFWLAEAFDPLTVVDMDSTFEADTTAPVITDVQVSSITKDGYFVTCTVTDDVAVARVQFPTWTAANGQDDLVSDWSTNSSCSGTIDGTTVTYYVSKSAHRLEAGQYTTNIYAYDRAGNYSCAAVPAVTLEGYDYPDGAGDVNMDGAVNVTDALLVLKSYVGLADNLNETQLVRADVTLDGEVDVKDALNILKYYVGLIVFE